MRQYLETRAGLSAIVLILAPLAGCSGPANAPASSGSQSPLSADVSKNRAWIEQQLTQPNAFEPAMADVFAAIKTSDPALYNQFMDVVAQRVSEGASPFEAGVAARPIFLARLVQLMQDASNADAERAIGISVRTFEYYLSHDAGQCIKTMRGGADPNYDKLPTKDDEMRLMASIFRTTKPGEPAATREEVTSWMQELVKAHPESAEGFQYFNLPVPAENQARAICGSILTMYRDLQQQPDQRRSDLFRGMLRMAK